MRSYFNEMLHGAGHLRFILQPIIAMLFGLRDGRLDEKDGRAPYIVSLFTDKSDRRARGKEGLKAIALPLCLAIVASLVFQFIVMRHVHVGAALLYAAVFVAFPYAVLRGLSNRSQHAREARHDRRGPQPV